ncbi:MerR family transcriptional regulator [Streptomyces sp. NPDC048383]|uniref:MerR family transcriptional regulator n=1 Tax=Streptomyces sp. NPDC048383 TaxID=3155386 RepID=UPI003430A0F5
MLIGDLSRRTGVRTHQLRYYESQGLLEPHRRSSGYREYGDDAVLTVGQIRKLLNAGLSTQEIAYLLPCVTGDGPDLEPCPQLLETLRTRLRGMDDHIETLSQTRQILNGYIKATERNVTEYDPSSGTGKGNEEHHVR